MKIVLGGRLDSLDLDRKNYGPTGVFQAASSFQRTACSDACSGGSWRAACARWQRLA